MSYAQQEQQPCPFCGKARRQHIAQPWGLDCPEDREARWQTELDQERAQEEDERAAEAQAYEDYAERQADIRRGIEDFPYRY